MRSNLVAPAGARSEPRMRGEVFTAVEEIPPVAPVAIRVLRMAEDPSASAADLGRVISRDQALSARVLRAANSPWVSPGAPVLSLSQAMVVLGSRSVRNLVLFHSLPVGNAPGRMGEAERGLWRHSVESALGAHLTAAAIGGVDPEFAFLAGLFHDIGRLLLLRACPGGYGRLWSEGGGRPSIEAERSAFGADHAEIGSGVLERWSVGEGLAQTARVHHHPEPELPRAALCVRAAERLLAADRMPEGAAGPLRSLLGLDEETLEALRARLRLALERESAMFGEAA